MGAQGITLKYDRVHTVLGERKFVLVVSEGAFGRKQTSFYDLFRVENVKIAEHWDTVETIPPPRAVEERQRQVRFSPGRRQRQRTKERLDACRSPIRRWAKVAPGLHYRR
jgi:hypothetical protein